MSNVKRRKSANEGNSLFNSVNTLINFNEIASDKEDTMSNHLEKEL